MNIYLDNQAEFYLKINKVPNNSAGIFFSYKEYKYIWWKNINNNFDAGEELNFNICFNKIKLQ